MMITPRFVTVHGALAIAAWLAGGVPAAAEIRVNPTGVNVNGQGATTVFLTFGPLDTYLPAEGLWCGEIVVTPESGARCDPATIYGMLPARYDRSRLSGAGAFTDIMSIPPSVTRRAYEAAAAGRGAAFFYVRRFVNTQGGPDWYVAVTCRLTGGGARVPLSLVDVRLGFDVETPVLQVERGAYVSPFAADIQYTGTGRLRGRWEVVMPGQELPTEEDLLTEATLPLERRGTQRRFAEVERFNLFLAPVGRVRLPGPDPAKLPTGAEGQYLILLRIEASDDKEGDSDLAAVGVGPGVVHSGGVAGFPMPVLRYIVGDGGNELSAVTPRDIEVLSPADGAVVDLREPLDLRWAGVTHARYYQLELRSGGTLIHQAFVARGDPLYRVPPFVAERVTGGDLTWRVEAIDGAGRAVARSRDTTIALRSP